MNYYWEGTPTIGEKGQVVRTWNNQSTVISPPVQQLLFLVRVGPALNICNTFIRLNQNQMKNQWYSPSLQDSIVNQKKRNWSCVKTPYVVLIIFLTHAKAAEIEFYKNMTWKQIFGLGMKALVEIFLFISE